jgi:hypothetical protein
MRADSYTDLILKVRSFWALNNEVVCFPASATGLKK